MIIDKKLVFQSVHYSVYTKVVCTLIIINRKVYIKRHSNKTADRYSTKTPFHII